MKAKIDPTIIERTNTGLKIIDVQKLIDENRAQVARYKLALVDEIKKIKELEKSLDDEQKQLWADEDKTFGDLFEDWRRETTREKNQKKVDAVIEKDFFEQEQPMQEEIEALENAPENKHVEIVAEKKANPGLTEEEIARAMSEEPDELQEKSQA